MVSKIRHIGCIVCGLLWNVIILPFILDYRCLRGRKKMLAHFLQKASQNSICRELLKETEKENISFGVFPIKAVFMSAKSGRDKRFIYITSKMLKGFLNGTVDINCIRFCIAHEKSHLEDILLIKTVLRKCKYAWHFSKNGYAADCFYLELLASQKAVRSLEKISGKSIQEILPEEYLAFLPISSFFQCKKCIDRGVFENKCLKIEELKEMGVDITKERKVMSIKMRPQKEEGNG